MVENISASIDELSKSRSELPNPVQTALVKDTKVTDTKAKDTNTTSLVNPNSGIQTVILDNMPAFDNRPAIAQPHTTPKTPESITDNSAYFIHSSNTASLIQCLCSRGIVTETGFAPQPL